MVLAIHVPFLFHLKILGLYKLKQVSQWFAHMHDFIQQNIDQYLIHHDVHFNGYM